MELCDPYVLAPGFPSLPPGNWRYAVARGECYRCQDTLGLVEPGDPGEVWFCTICQGDLSKAGVEFVTCDSCENVNVCPLCCQAANSTATVTTYRASALRRRAEALKHGAAGTSAVLGGSSGSGFGSGVSPVKSHAPTSRLSSFSGEQREVRMSRRGISAVVAAVEGHGGEGNRLRGRCATCSRGDEVVEEDADEDETDSSEEGNDSGVP
ncbi:unnamed protein product [Polarella glacialis]|uniref:Uncharacterized protein n=1 Tax=Polarella glacialis TaxID=89957 RepID=A0A813K197_POLGL|nr:unnamed protein product [Polarella glacialis]